MRRGKGFSWFPFNKNYSRKIDELDDSELAAVIRKAKNHLNDCIKEVYEGENPHTAELVQLPTKKAEKLYYVMENDIDTAQDDYNDSRVNGKKGAAAREANKARAISEGTQTNAEQEDSYDKKEAFMRNNQAFFGRQENPNFVEEELPFN